VVNYAKGRRSIPDYDDRQTTRRSECGSSCDHDQHLVLPLLNTADIMKLIKKGSEQINAILSRYPDVREPVRVRMFLIAQSERRQPPAQEIRFALIRPFARTFISLKGTLAQKRFHLQAGFLRRGEMRKWTRADGSDFIVTRVSGCVRDAGVDL